MPAAQTSILSYYDLKASGKMGKLQSTIYSLIRENANLSNRDIARILGLEICTVTGRVNELCEMGLVRAWAKKKDPRTNRSVQVWRAVE